MSLFTHHSRRSFLRLGSSCIALPFLETFAGATLAVNSPPKRMVFFNVGNGFTKETFYPIKGGSFSDIGLTEGLAPLKEHQNDFTMIANLTNLGATNPHAGCTSFLTGANVEGTPGKTFFNSVSCDQIAAQHLGKETRFPSLILTTSESNSGYGPGLSMSWTADGNPMPGIVGAFDLYEALFVQKKESAAEREIRFKTNSSIFDAQRLSGGAIKNTLSKTDAGKLEEYFESIRQIEKDLARQAQWSNIPKPKAPFAAPAKVTTGSGNSPNGITEMKLIYDMIVLALQTDSTRVVTYRQPVRTVLAEMGISMDAHSITHYGFSIARKEASLERDKKCTELLAYFLTKLKNIKDQDGSRLYDNCIVSWGTNLRSGHELRDLPLIISGGGAKKINHGKHLVLPKVDTPLANVWLTLMQQAGVPVDSFSHSTGIVPELIA